MHSISPLSPIEDYKCIKRSKNLYQNNQRCTISRTPEIVRNLSVNSSLDAYDISEVFGM